MKKDIFCIFLSSSFLIFSFPNFNLGFLVFISFVPLFFAIQNKPPKKAFLISYISGLLFYLGTLYWLYHVTVVGLIMLCLYLALYFGIFGLLFRAFSLQPSAFSYFLFPFIWTLLEYIQSHLFTGFGWALLGYSQYKNTTLIQIADFSGVYGVSFVIMLVNTAIWKSIRAYSVERIAYRKTTKRYPLSAIRYICYVALLLMLVYGYGYLRLNKETASKRNINVSVIQGNIPQDVKWKEDASGDILNKYISLTRQAAFDNPDLIIWPETAFPGFLVEDKDLTLKVFELAKEINTNLLIGANTVEDFKIFNSAVLISNKGKIIDKYDKIHLVPFGEYVPFSDRIPILHNLVLGQLGEFTAGNEFKILRTTNHPSTEFTPSPSTSLGINSAEGLGTSEPRTTTDFSALICFEDIFPEISRQFVKSGAQFLIVITNDAWYGKSGAPYQHAACSVFRAIENRVPIVRCANTGYSCFIDAKGRIYDSVEQANTHLFITAYKTSRVNF